MDYISRALPELLWLDRLKMTTDTIEIEGRAFNTNAVANFIDNLDKVPEFDEPTLKITEQQQGGIYSFLISFHYSFATHAKPAEGEPAGGLDEAGIAQDATHVRPVDEDAVHLLDSWRQLVAPRDVVGGAGGEDLDLAMPREALGDVTGVKFGAAVD